MRKIALLCIFLPLIWTSCQDEPKEKKQKDHAETKAKSQDLKINFSADSAYRYVEAQVNFGPRVPGSVAHGLAANYLLNQLERFCDTSFIQEGQMRSANGKYVPVRNIIGVIKPERSKRVLLCAHWDTRPMADEDSERPSEPADGANDGASGVGVLLEIARQLQLQPPDIGIDIIFFDAEDMGDSKKGMESWCLGSQYWSHHPHKENYNANYGILLDMVGPPNAIFAMEAHSVIHAKPIVEKVWLTARSLGYGNHFIMYQGGMITDDHYFINTIAEIPTIDIIHYDPASGSGFGEFWHTHADNMESIDPNTLLAVGETLLKVIYSE